MRKSNKNYVLLTECSGKASLKKWPLGWDLKDDKQPIRWKEIDKNPSLRSRMCKGDGHFKGDGMFTEMRDDHWMGARERGRGQH